MQTKKISPLKSKWTFYTLNKSRQRSYDKYEDMVQDIGSFQTIEEFWGIYSHLKRPNTIETLINYYLFKDNIPPLWEHERNVKGGNLQLRLKKGFASYYWEVLIMSLIGKGFDDDVVGASVSVRQNEDVMTVWNKTGKNNNILMSIVKSFCDNLNLPVETVFEYKEHEAQVKDTRVFKVEIDGPVEITNKKVNGGKK